MHRLTISGKNWEDFFFFFSLEGGPFQTQLKPLQHSTLRPLKVLQYRCMNTPRPTPLNNYLLSWGLFIKLKEKTCWQLNLNLYFKNKFNLLQKNYVQQTLWLQCVINEVKTNDMKLKGIIRNAKFDRHKSWILNFRLKFK